MTQALRTGDNHWYHFHPTVQISCICLEILVHFLLLIFSYPHCTECQGDIELYFEPEVQQDYPPVYLHTHLTMNFYNIRRKHQLFNQLNTQILRLER